MNTQTTGVSSAMPIVPGTHVLYTIQSGDTLYEIANRTGASLPDLIRQNALYPPITEPDLIYPGWAVLIRLPGMTEHSGVLHQAAPGDTIHRIADRYSVGTDMLAALNRLEQPDILSVAQLIYVPAFVYETEVGDTLYRISRRYGVPLAEIIRANRDRPGLSPDLIYPGYRLIIPLPSSTSIVVFQPLPGSRIASGQPLVGAARAFEANVLYQIRDAADRVVVRERPVTASEGAPAFGRFEDVIRFDHPPSARTGTLLVYTRSPRDGSVQDLVEVPVTF